MQNKSGKCPGCGRHCPLDAPRCKYGIRYANKIKGEKVKEERRFKWEKYVASGGVVWKMLHVSRNAKKSLVRGVVTEEQLLAALTDSERRMLEEILEKLNVCTTSSLENK